MPDTPCHILQIATAFRDAVERCDRRRWPIAFEHFPRGCCGLTADLLGVYLVGEGFPSIEYVAGLKTDPADPRREDSHAWLEGYGLLVDVTVDQFPEVTERVVVGPALPIHRQYAEEMWRRPPGIAEYLIAGELRRAYADIRAEIARS